MQFAKRVAHVEVSAIREFVKLMDVPGIISLAGGMPDSSLFDVAGLGEAAAKALAQEPANALQYGQTEGYEPLRLELSRYMQGKGAEARPDELIVTTGSLQALDLIGKALISPGDKVIVEAPTFLAAIQCFRLYGAELVTAPVDAHGVKTEELEALMAEHRPKLVYLIPTFGNPAGTVLSPERRRKVLELAVKYQTLIVEDDPYGDLYFGDTPAPSLLAMSDAVSGSRDFIAHCGSLSKVLSPGLRIGWLIAPAPLLAKTTICKQFSDANTSTFAQATASQYLKSGRMPGNVARMRAAYEERAVAMDAALRRELGDAVAYSSPRGGMFFWVRLTGSEGALADARELSERAVRRLVAFVPGRPFFARNPDSAFFRLSFASVDVAKIDEGIARLGLALRE